MDKYFVFLIAAIACMYTLICLYVFVQYRDPAVGLWGAAGLFYILGYVFALVLITYYLAGNYPEVQPMMKFLSWVFTILAGYLILQGVHLFIEVQIPRWWLYFYLLGVLLSIIHTIMGYDSHPFMYISYIYQGSGLLGAGRELLLYKGSLGTWKRITGVTLLSFGAVFILSSTMILACGRPAWMIPLTLLLALILSSLSFVGLIIVFFQKKIYREKTQLAIISHDLKAPVAVLRSYTQAMLDGVYPEQTLQGNIMAMDSEVEQMGNKIHRLLFLNKLDHLINQNEFKNKPVYLAKLILECIERFRIRRPELVWDTKIMPLSITGDCQQWEVALENLLDNQLRYAVHRLEISFIEIGRNKGLLRIWNDGPPIEPGLLKKLFKEYESGKGGEHGLGLSIVKKVVDAHQARIWAVNEAEGAAFYIEMEIESIS